MSDNELILKENPTIQDFQQYVREMKKPFAKKKRSTNKGCGREYKCRRFVKS